MFIKLVEILEFLQKTVKLQLKIEGVSLNLCKVIFTIKDQSVVLPFHVTY